MNYLGLIRKYPSNRPLTDAERRNQLRQKVRLNVEPHYQLCVIKMNSTYIESVDKWFAWKGLISWVMLVVIVMFGGLWFGLLSISLARDEKFRGEGDDFSILIGAAGIILPVMAGAIWMLCKDSFAYTHYPMRFDRKNRMVHIFRTNGTVLSSPWDDIFFTLGHLAPESSWEVRGHIINQDGDTVRETFALSYFGSLPNLNKAPEAPNCSSEDFVRAHWEFIRRFMEDGPEAILKQVQFCMPVDGRKESVRVGFARVFANFAGAPAFLYWAMYPFCFLVGLGRVFAMRTSKVPRWPSEIESACVVEQNDPYAIMGARDGERMAVFKEAALEAGICFVPHP